MGYGIIIVTGSSVKLLRMDILKMNSKDDAYQRLQKIHSKVTEIIQEYQPQFFAIEAPFFGKNVQSMLKLGRAQGVAIAAAMQAGIPVCEYAPRKIKQSITGNGNAGKEQVLKMLQEILQFTDVSKSFDAADALAVALCHHYQQNSFATLSSGTSVSVVKSSGWGSFIKANPGRVK